MSRFDILTKYINTIEVDNIGEWIVDKESDGIPEHSKNMSFVDYSEVVQNFIKDVCTFEKSNKIWILPGMEIFKKITTLTEVRNL